MMCYSNVVLHPNASHKQLDKPTQESLTSTWTLTIMNELYKITNLPFEQFQFVDFGLPKKQPDGPVYTAPEHIYASQTHPAMIAKIK